MMDGMPTPALSMMLQRLQALPGSIASERLQPAIEAAPAAMPIVAAEQPVPGFRAHHAKELQSGRARLLRHVLHAYFRQHAPGPPPPIYLTAQARPADERSAAAHWL